MEWVGDRVPSEDGYGGVHGDCPYCGEKLMWTGWGWSVHSVGYHAGVQRRLVRAVRRLVDLEADLKLWRAETAADGCVGIRWRCGVYPGWQSELRTSVPYEAWDSADHGMLLRIMREGNTWALKARYGADVNPATWFHKVYDGRSTPVPLPPADPREPQGTAPGAT